MNLFMKCLAVLPLPVLRALGWLLGTAVYLGSGRRRRIARTNLRLAFRQASADRIEGLVRGHFIALAQSLLDRAWLWHGSEALVRSRITVHGAHTLAAHERIIMLAPHMVGVDMGGSRLAMEGRPMTTLYQPQRNQAMDAAILAGRKRFGNVTVYSRQEGVRKTLTDMKAGYMFYCLPDMDFGPKDAVFVPLFGELAATLTVLPKLARLAKAVVVPVITRMTRDGYDIHVETAWTDMAQMDVEQAARRMNAAVEGWALAAGPEYLWSHRRYKTRPEGGASIY